MVFSSRAPSDCVRRLDFAIFASQSSICYGAQAEEVDERVEDHEDERNIPSSAKTVSQRPMWVGGKPASDL